MGASPGRSFSMTATLSSEIYKIEKNGHPYNTTTNSNVVGKSSRLVTGQHSKLSVVVTTVTGMSPPHATTTETELTTVSLLEAGSHLIGPQQTKPRKQE